MLSEPHTLFKLIWQKKKMLWWTFFFLQWEIRKKEKNTAKEWLTILGKI